MAVPIDHGQWVIYKPDTLPEGAPSGAMFSHRESDGVDWYEYISGANFDATSVKLTVWPQQNPVDPSVIIIRAPAVDPTLLFPGNQQVVELPGDYSGYTMTQLINAFCGKVIDLTTGDITDLPNVPSSQSTISKLIKRVEELERKYGLHTGN